MFFSCAVARGDEFALYNYLIDKTRYSANVRPVMDADKTVDVKVKLELSHIESLVKKPVLRD